MADGNWRSASSCIEFFVGYKPAHEPRSASGFHGHSTRANQSGPPFRRTIAVSRVNGMPGGRFGCILQVAFIVHEGSLGR